MTESVKSGDLGRLTAFAAALSSATIRVNDFSTQLIAPSKTFQEAARQIAHLSSSAAQITAPSQQITTSSQCACAVPTEPTSSASSFLDTIKRVFVPVAALVTTTGAFLAAGRWLLTIDIGLRLTKTLSAIGEAMAGFWAVVDASEIFAAVAEAATELTAAVAALAASPVLAVIAEIAVAVAALAGVAYLIWRNWHAIVTILRTAAKAVSGEAVTLMRKVSAALNGDSQERIEEDPELSADIAKRGRTWARPTTYFAKLPLLASAPSGQPSIGPHFLGGAGSLRNAALLMLAAPLLAAPTLAGVPSGRPVIDGIGAASIVINSSPTITVNCSETDDIQPRMLEVLRQHREAIYEQWCSEVQRRQRTEF